MESSSTPNFAFSDSSVTVSEKYSHLPVRPRRKKDYNYEQWIKIASLLGQVTPNGKHTYSSRSLGEVFQVGKSTFNGWKQSLATWEQLEPAQKKKKSLPTGRPSKWPHLIQPLVNWIHGRIQRSELIEMWIVLSKAHQINPAFNPHESKWLGWMWRMLHRKISSFESSPRELKSSQRNILHSKPNL